MPAHSRVRAPGLWVPGSTILQSELETLDDNAANSISTTGGTYAPAGVITIGGAGLNVTGQCQLSNIQAATFNCPVVSTEGATITQSTVNTDGVNSIGNGTAAGVRGIGGGTSGSGGIFVGGNPNGKGVECTGTGTGVGAQIVGGSLAVAGATITGGGIDKIGLIAAPSGPTTAAIRVDTWGVHLNGSQPAVTADPGANMLHSTNTCKAWANISTGGTGPLDITLHDGFNVASVSINLVFIVVQFARPMANTTYSVSITGFDGAARFYVVASGGLGVNTFSIRVFDSAGVGLDPSSDAMKMMVQVFGRQ